VVVVQEDTTPQTGDVIRFVDVQGSLNYNVSLKVRAPVGVALQGSTSGSGGYAGGELIVNTPNAGFALIFVGITDSDGNGIPDTNRGWWFDGDLKKWHTQTLVAIIKRNPCEDFLLEQLFHFQELLILFLKDGYLVLVVI